MSEPGMSTVRNAMDAHLAAHTEHDQAREQTAGERYAAADQLAADQLAAGDQADEQGGGDW